MLQKLREKIHSIKLGKLKYLIFLLPFFLAFVSWLWFPKVAEYLATKVFSYTPTPQPTHWLWHVTIWFFYTWYTFLAIGIAGILAIAAWFSRKKEKIAKKGYYSMVSFVVPAHNEQDNVSRCLASLFESAFHYSGLTEIIVIDDGSTDCTYELAWATIELYRKKYPSIRGKVVRHTANLGKIEAIKTGVNKALGSVIAIVDADSWWQPDTLNQLIKYMNSEGKAAVTGYIHPSDGAHEQNPYVILQQLEYSQGLGIFRSAQSLGNAVLVVPGAIGIYEANVLRNILNEKKLKSITEDLEITLEMQKRKLHVGYADTARSSTVAPASFTSFWNQRLRWFTGWIHNTLEIHRNMLFNKKWLSLLLWYCLIFEYCGAILDIVAVTSFPFLFWFAPDRILFILNMFFFIPYIFIIGLISQAIALKFAYNEYNHKKLLFYTPFYNILQFINVCARFISSIKYLLGNKGNWRKKL